MRATTRRRELKRIPVRLPTALYRRLSAKANRERSSMSRLVLIAIEQLLTTDEETS